MRFVEYGDEAVGSSPLFPIQVKRTAEFRNDHFRPLVPVPGHPSTPSDRLARPNHSVSSPDVNRSRPALVCSGFEPGQHCAPDLDCVQFNGTTLDESSYSPQREVPLHDGMRHMHLAIRCLLDQPDLDQFPHILVHALDVPRGSMRGARSRTALTASRAA